MRSEKIETITSNTRGSAGSAIGIVIALGVVLIGMYIIAIVTSSLGDTLPASNVFTTEPDVTSPLSIASILPIAIVGVGIMTIVIGAFAIGSDTGPSRSQSTGKTVETGHNGKPVLRETADQPYDNNFVTYGDRIKIEFPEKIK